jgi:outer membrane lipoprotein-sorting protein
MIASGGSGWQGRIAAGRLASPAIRMCRRMTQGRAPLVAAGLALALLAGGGAAEPAAPPSLEALMAGMAQTPGVEARFLERKEIALLSEPLETRGTLIFLPPDRLVRTTDAPSRSRLVIAGERLSFRDAAGGNAVDLSANPLAREFVDNFIVLFNGDLAALRERYEPALTSEGERWSLVLTPRHRPLSDLIERITLTGAGRALVRMEMLERDGDRSTTSFEAVQVDRRFTPAEVERLFVLDASE